MNEDRLKEFEEKIADLKRRMPPHSMPPWMWRELDELEEELQKVKKEAAGK